jgi:RNA polymerase sigma factor (sigma-70 family)
MGCHPVRGPMRVLAGDAAPLPPIHADEQLIERIANGDSDALGLLFDRHHRTLYGFLRRVGGVDDADLDDLVQATFLEARRAAARFRGLSSARTWLFAIGANLARNNRRALMRRQRAIDRMTSQPKRASTSPEQRSAIPSLCNELQQRSRRCRMTCASPMSCVSSKKWAQMTRLPRCECRAAPSGDEFIRRGWLCAKPSATEALHEPFRSAFTA